VPGYPRDDVVETGVARRLALIEAEADIRDGIAI